MTRSDTSHRPLARLTCMYCTCMGWMSLVFLYVSFMVLLPYVHAHTACYLLTRSPRRAIKAVACFLLNRSSHRVIKVAQPSRKEKRESVQHVQIISSLPSLLPVHESLLVSCKKKIHHARWPTVAHRTYQHVGLSTRKQTGAHVALSRTERQHVEITVARRNHCSDRRITVHSGKSWDSAEITVAAQEHCSSEEFFPTGALRGYLECCLRWSVSRASVILLLRAVESSCSVAHFFLLPNQVSLFLPV
jgi:hypothetical protein